MALEQKLSADNFLSYLWMLNPERFVSVAHDRTGKNPIDALRGSRVLPALFNLIIIRRAKGSTTKIGKHEISCAEIPPAYLTVVEIKPFYNQRVKYRQMHIEEHDRLQTAMGASDSNDTGPSAFQNTGAVRRLVLGSSNGGLNSFLQKGLAAKAIFNEIFNSTTRTDSLSDRLSEFYYRITRPEVWLPLYARDRISNILYQVGLSSKKAYVLGRIGTLVYVEGRKLVIYNNWPYNQFDIEVLLSAAGIPFVSVKALSA